MQMGTRKRPKEVGLSLVRDERVDDSMERRTTKKSVLLRARQSEFDRRWQM